MFVTKKILVLILLQGLLPEFLGQRWEFPSQITGLIGSCMEIPCTFQPARNSRTSSTVWYLYHRSNNLQIFNSQESSEVLINYRNRTSLVNGSSSCSLRIDPVSANDGRDYYPGIIGDEETNAYSLHGRYIRLHVTDFPSPPKLVGSRTMFEGHPEVVECSVEHTCRSSPPSLLWNKPGRTVRRTENISGELWREILRLTYNPSYKDDKTLIQCTATYHNDIRTHNAEILDIRHAATGVQVIVLSIEEATELKCDFVSSNPNVTHYTWIKNGITLANKIGQILVLDSNEDESGSYSCMAHNTAGSSISTALGFRDSRAEDENGANLLLILLILPGIIILLFLVMIVYFCTRSKLRQGTPRLPNPEPPGDLYAVLEKTDNPSEYETIKNPEPPGDLYAVLEKTDNPSEYETIKLPSLSSPAANATD